MKELKRIYAFAVASQVASILTKVEEVVDCCTRNVNDPMLHSKIWNMKAAVVDVKDYLASKLEPNS